MIGQVRIKASIRSQPRVESQPSDRTACTYPASQSQTSYPKSHSQEFLVAGLIGGPGVYRWVPVGAFVGAASVVPGLDIVEHGGFGLTVGGEAIVVVELGLEMREPVLGHGVVPADSGAAHRLGDPVASTRSEERRVGNECRQRRTPHESQDK